ncbi:uncharacterized protein LOC117830175 [Xyrichtys novacula]|uniref:Uncharacterized protein LOC117830175 n=1 Tax=Xyrichtys novacula TaxID=13765 RepID=A0AAV1H8Z5_XYRNO|nr:uncharacterized protein LOC117830175 [Xyrichtys novacula]
MRAQRLNCVLGLLCMSAEVILGMGTVSQEPSSISFMRVNSSAEITCSTSTSGALGFSLHRYFKNNEEIVYQNLKNGEVTKTTIKGKFEGRIRVTPAPKIHQGQGFILQLSLLGVEDTDVYFCSWSYLSTNTAIPPTQSSKGTVIIVREKDPKEQCKHQMLDLIFIVLSVTAFIVVLLFFIVVLTKCNRFHAHFRPTRAETASRPARPQLDSTHFAEHYPYLITSAGTVDDRHPAFMRA